MWSRIKQLALPISTKLTILYTFILTCILLFTSVLTVMGVYYVLYIQADNDVGLSANSVISYLDAGNQINRQLLEKKLLVPGVILRIFDDQSQLLIDSAPYIPGSPAISGKEEEGLNLLKFVSLRKRILHMVHIDNYYFYYARETVWQDGHLYQLYFIKTISEQTRILKILIKILLVTNSLSLLIAVLSGMFISRSILRPIRDITDTAKEIEVSNLGKRIKVTASNDELQELAKTFNHMLNEIQSGFEQQRRFVSDASHELRTPITVISGYVDMLDRWGKQDPSVLDEGIEAIKSEASNMYSLIEKLLFLARTDQNKQIIKKTAVEMKPLIDEIAQETQMIAPNHLIRLQQNDQAGICADASFIKEMLRIFIENSIKYTPAGGTIGLSSRKAGDYLEITIQDTGIGIAAEDQPKIFDRFYRVDKSRSKVTGGTGLGLSIARWIAEQHHITIQIASNPGEGTVVTVLILLIS